jgi:hypothetical protein
MADPVSSTQLAALVDRYGVIASGVEALVSANFDVLGGTIDDPDSFNAVGGKTGALGYYQLTNANGQTAYFPCLQRLLLIAGGPGGAGAVQALLDAVIAVKAETEAVREQVAGYATAAAQSAAIYTDVQAALAQIAASLVTTQTIVAAHTAFA